MTLAELQQIVREKIVADAWFAAIEDAIIIEARGDLEQELERLLDELGLSVVVATPSSEVKERGSRAWLRVEVVIALAEMPLTNGTGKHAHEALDRIIPLLHGTRLAKTFQLQFSGHETEDIPGMATYRAQFSADIVYQHTKE